MGRPPIDGKAAMTAAERQRRHRAAKSRAPAGSRLNCCAFCGEAASPASPLVAGDRAAICATCVETAMEMIAEQS
jgi:hypothetical protein